MSDRARLNRETMLLNEATILGHAEGKTSEQRAAARSLCRAGKLRDMGPMRGWERGARWYKLAPDVETLIEGPRVRFLIDDLGASEADDLTRTELAPGRDRAPGDGTRMFEVLWSHVSLLLPDRRGQARHLAADEVDGHEPRRPR